MATEPEILEIAVEWAAKRAPQGLILTDEPFGHANGAIINAHIMKNGGVVSFITLSQAAEAEKFRLSWEPGFEPKAPAAAPRKRRDAFNEMVDAGAGAPRRTDSHADHLASAGDRAKAAQERQAAIDARAKAASDAAQRARDESVIIYYESGDRINHGATETARLQARQKWAKAQGRSLAPTVIREIPTDRELTRSEMNAFTPEELDRYIKSQKRGRGY